MTPASSRNRAAVLASALSERGLAATRRAWRKLGLLALLLLLPLLALGAVAEEQSPAQAPAPTAEATPPAVTIPIHYLSKAYPEPVPLSLVDKPLTDNGLQGARLALTDNNKSGSRFSASTTS